MECPYHDLQPEALAMAGYPMHSQGVKWLLMAVYICGILYMSTKNFELFPRIKHIHFNYE